VKGLRNSDMGEILRHFRSCPC